MKKTALLLAFVMMLALFACDETVHDPKTPAISQNNTNITSTEETTEQSHVAENTVPEENNSTEATISETLLLDEAGVKITAKSLDNDEWWGPEVKILIENTFDRDLTVQVRNCSVNGYMIEPLFSVDVAAGKKANDSISFSSSDLESAGIDTIADIELSFHVFYTDDWETHLDSAPVTLKTSAADTHTYTYDDSGLLAFDDNNIKFVVKDLIYDDFMGPSLVVYAYNGSNQTITLQTREDSVNGFMVDTFFSLDVLPGKHAVSDITFSTTSLEENEITEISEYEFYLHIYDADTWDTILDSDIISLTFE